MFLEEFTFTGIFYPVAPFVFLFCVAIIIANIIISKAGKNPFKINPVKFYLFVAGIFAVEAIILFSVKAVL